MALPTRTVRGRYLLADDETPATGTVTFQPNVPLQAPADDVLIPARPLRAVLDDTGAFEVTLICTDATDAVPSGWVYAVAEDVNGYHREYSIGVPTSGEPLDLADVAATVPGPVQISYVLAAMVGQPGGPAGPLDGDGKVPADQLPDGIDGAITSVNGDTGPAVTLDATDVGASPTGHNHSGTYDPAGTAAAALATAEAYTDTAAAARLAKTANLSDLGNAGTARGNLGLGTAATRDVGTITGTVAAGDDTRLSDARTPTTHASTHASAGSDPLSPGDIGAVPTTRQLTAGTGLTGGGDLSANRTYAVAYGTAAGTAAAGNDSRITGAVQASTATAKGDLLAASGSGAITRRAVGTDGQLLAADSAQPTGLAWVDPPSGGTGLRTADSGFITTGNIPAGTSYTQLGPDLPIDAAAGDILEIGTDILCNDSGTDVQFEAVTRVSGADSGFWSTGTTTGRWPGGIAGWYVQTGLFDGPRGMPRYTVQPGDVVSGQVTVRLYARVTGGVRNVMANASYPLRWWINNLGAPA